MKNRPQSLIYQAIHDIESARILLQKQADELRQFEAKFTLFESQRAEHETIILNHKAALEEKNRVIEQKEKEARYNEAVIQKLSFELARLKRMKFQATTEALNAEQLKLFEENLDEDIQALTAQLEALQEAPVQDSETPPCPPKGKPKRQPFPDHLERVDILHEPASCQCEACGNAMKKIGEEISEKLSCKPIEFFVERHIRPTYACSDCETLKIEPMPAQIIDKGQPTAALLAQVLIAKYVDHLPLYRQEKQYQERSGVIIPRNTMAGWVAACGIALSPLVERMREHQHEQQILHADETPVKVLQPGTGKTHRGYMWVYRSGIHSDCRIALFDFQMSRAGKHPVSFLEGFQGALMIDDYAGYNAVFRCNPGSTQLACLAHIRRYFFDLHIASKSKIAQEALVFISKLYHIEETAKEWDSHRRKTYRDTYARPILDAFHTWLMTKKTGVPQGSGIAKAINYALNCWTFFIRYLDNGCYPIDNNPAENIVRPLAVGRKNWLFFGTELAGQRAANIMSLIATAQINGLNPYLYLKDVLERLPTHPYNRLDELLPYNWKLPPSVHNTTV